MAVAPLDSDDFLRNDVEFSGVVFHFGKSMGNVIDLFYVTLDAVLRKGRAMRVNPLCLAPNISEIDR